MKKLSSLFIGVIIVVTGLFWFYFNSQPVSKESRLVNFHIASGSTATQIGADLYKQGIIKNATLFKIYTQFSGASFNIQAGDYKISPSFNLFQIVSILQRSPTSVKITIPEGYNRQEIAARLAKSLDVGQAFISEFLELSENDEGYLFPDTYFVAINATPSALIDKMKVNFDNRTRGYKPSYDQLILASLIEEETKSLEERPIVAGILMNRLRIGMALQVDVAPDTYNTIGLPNAPISNPGIDSIKASINPSKTDYWYYIHDPSGVIHYAKTLDEHNANIDKYLR